MIVKIMGGLGNQLFGYAFGYAVAKEKGEELILDTENYDIYFGPKYMLESFQIKESRFIQPCITQKQIYKLYKLIKMKCKGIQTYTEKELFVLDREVYHQDKKTLYVGYWQNYKYFERYKKDIENNFELLNVSSELADRISKIAKDDVAVHVRRGDYKTFLGGKCLGKEYYYEVLGKCLNKNSNSRFHIFTDDVEYCKELFKDYNMSVVSEQYKMTDLEEFYYMSKFCNIITANSTFSWWAAYLHDDKKEVYAPIADMWTEEFYPENWIVVNAQISTESE